MNIAGKKNEYYETPNLLGNGGDETLCVDVVMRAASLLRISV